MRIQRLGLDEFRLYRHVLVDMPADGLRLFGANASGKTSLLESIYLLATTRSPRAALERDLINWQSNQEYGLAPYARVAAVLLSEDHSTHEIELTLSADTSRPTTIRKRAKVDGRPRRISDLIGVMKVVLFSPEDLSLVLGSPSVRRRFLDITISQLDRTYLRALGRFGKLVERRNSLLKDLAARADGRSAEEELAYWDEQFTTYAAYLLAARFQYVHRLNWHLDNAFSQLAGPDLRLSLHYTSTVDLLEPQIVRIATGPLADAQPLLARAIETQLHRRRSEELRRGATVIGPHRDDFGYLLADRDLAAFGSRGQQRLAVVATKLAELARVIEVSGEAPILLLDDVLSELDPAHQENLLGVLGEAGCQIIVTATSRDLLEHPSLANLPIASTRDSAIQLESAG